MGKTCLGRTYVAVIWINESSNSAYSVLRLQDSKTDEDLQMVLAEIETIQHHIKMIQVAAAIEIESCET